MAATILIADDDPVQRRLVENMVQKCGYDAIVADGGDAAIAVLTGLDAVTIDAIVLDLVMPGLDGMGVLDRIREAGLNIPVIVQTAHGGIDNVVSAMRAGAHDFVVKPVGMERLARAIHGSSERKSKPFVAVNCGAIPDNLVESILFGHEKGAFTGATERHMGKFVEASGGTLFLDEISELPLAAQVKLLRALQEGAVEAVGGRKPVKVDVRIVSATNRKLLERVKSGQFRED